MKKIKMTKMMRRIMRREFYTLTRESFAKYGNRKHAQWLMRQARSYF